jgi:hypothetical protein
VKHLWLQTAVLNEVSAGSITPEARSDLQRCVRALPMGFLEITGAVLAEARHPEPIAKQRGGGVLLMVCAIQLADDLADGECTYLEAPALRGPGAQALLQVLALRCLLRGEVPPSVLAQALDDLAAVGCAQQREVSTARWDADAYLWLAREINGRQQAAYLALLLAGTSHEPRARELGLSFGTCSHVVGDARTQDKRWQSLSASDRKVVASAALQASRTAQAFGLRALQPHLEFAEGFAAALAAD